MATITVNVQHDVESKFRQRVYELYGRRKGTLGKALTEAMDEWSNRKQHLELTMRLLKEGIDMGKLNYKHRRELYDRR